MARGLEKVIVAREDLPSVCLLSNGTYGYVVRYRITSEDQNRFSHWSPIREISILEPELVDGGIAVSGNIIQAVWDDETGRPRYDIFVKFDSEEYSYHGTSPTHQYSFLKKSGATSVRVAVQVESVEKNRSEFLTIYESPVTSLV